ncbi:choice-of-anchor G family protein [Cellulomonas iranensis]|uniref:choice-of-anchor G family protein n=1 Tax=Cellulomonas iranensis TaxID=76862 RepID=UPI0013D16B76|nr:choice-of-anchor G family protein [Cellulomonas iranensis]
MRAAVRALVAAAAAAAVAAPAVVSTSTAAWREDEWTHGLTATSSLRCGQDDGFTATSAGRFLSGSLLGTNLDPVAALQGVRLVRAADGALTVTPPTAIDPGSPAPTATRLNPLTASALSVVGLDLTGLGVGLPVGSAGALNQYAQVSGYGTATGAAGLVSDSGGVQVTPTTPSSALPGPAYVSLGTLLPSITNLADTRLRVGAVASSAQLDGCADLRAMLWGDGTATGAVRSYGVADVGLQTSSPVLGQLVQAVNATVGTLQTNLGTLGGTSGPIAAAIRTGLLGQLGAGLSLAPLSGTVTVSTPDVAGAVAPLLTAPLTDGVVTLNLSSGVIDVDLDALLGYAPGALSNQPPNTEVVLSAAVLNPLLTRVGALLDTWTGQVVQALLTAVRSATVTVDLTTTVAASATVLGTPTTVNVAGVRVQLTAPVGAILDSAAGTAVPPNATVSVTATGLAGTLVNTVLGILGLSLSSITGALNGSGAALLGLVAPVLRTALVVPVTTLGTTLATLSGTLVTALSSLVTVLPSVVSLMLNVQPDRPGAPPGEPYTAGTATSTPEYRVTALRLGLARYTSSADVAHVRFATSTAGPVGAP